MSDGRLYRSGAACLLAGLLAAASVAGGQEAPAQDPHEILWDWFGRNVGRLDLPGLFTQLGVKNLAGKEAFNNPPESFGFPIDRCLANLPRSGRAKLAPYPGHWWPMKKDGTACRFLGPDIPSPLEKYDKVFGLPGMGGTATEWEIQRHGSRAQGVDKWWGHCNGWSAAATVEKEPTRAVKVGEVTFTAAELKALLAEVYYCCGAGMLDARVDNDNPPLDRYGRPEDPKYRDINPGAMHLLLANLIGRQGKPFVMDFTAGMQVWNYPVYGYEVQQVQEVDGSRALGLVAGQELQEPYPFNPAARKFAHVRVQVIQIASSPPQADNTSARLAEFSHRLDYEYILELDDQGCVIGGEWVGNSKKEHPDFAWVVFNPLEAYTVTPDGRYEPARNYSGNPFVSYSFVKRLLEGQPDLASATPPRPAPPAPPSAEPARRPPPPTDAAPPPLPQPAAGDPAPIIIARPQPAPDDQVETLVRTGDWQLRENQLDLAQERYRQAQEAQARQAQSADVPALEQARQRQRLTAIQARLAIVHQLRREPAQALQVLDGALSERPDEASLCALRCMVRLANAKGDALKRAQAQADAGRALKLAPAFSWAHCAMGWVHLTHAHYKPAGQDRERDLANAQGEFGAALKLESNAFFRASLLLTHPQGSPARQALEQELLRQVPAQQRPCYQGQLGIGQAQRQR